MARQSYSSWAKRERRNLLLSTERYVEHFHSSPRLGKVLMVFPGSYKVAMANLGYQHIMRLWLREGFEVDRLFLEDSLEEEWSFEKEYPIDAFDIISISLPFEGGIPNLVRFIHKIRKMPSRPIIILGGATTYFNPFIFSDYVDFVVVGDGESSISQIVSYLGSSNYELPPWIIRPGDSKAVVNKIFSLKEPAYSLIIPKESVFEDFFLIEIGRGCHVGCRFCVYGYTYRPVRFFPVNVIDRIVSNLKIDSNAIGLISSSLSLHPDAVDITKFVMEKGYRPVPSSLHVNESTPELISLLVASGNRSLTFAVEHGDPEYQVKLGKSVDADHLNLLLKVSKEEGLRSVKLYFILGLGDDPIYNAESGVSFIKRALSGLKDVKVTISFSILVPKPWTPFENLKFPSKSFVTKEIRTWKKLLVKYGLNVQLVIPSYKEAYEEYVFSRFYGDLAFRYVLENENLRKLLDEANSKQMWKNVFHIDPGDILDIEMKKFQLGQPPLGCIGDCSNCVVKRIKERRDSFV